MKVRNVLILLAAVYLGLFQIPYWLTMSEHEQGLKAEKKSLVESHLNDFKEKINEDIKYLACLKEGPFPFSTLGGNKSEDSSNVTYKCEKCDMLFHAGLLDKKVIEYIPPPEMQKIGGSKFETRFELTDLGRSAYVQGTTDGPYSKDPPRFCFGNARVDEITRTIGPINFGGNKNVGIRYVAVLENPHPYLSDPRAQLLGIPLPLGNPPLYPEANVTAMFYADDSNFELDSSLTIVH